jgi:hypothetical protein
METYNMKEIRLTFDRKTRTVKKEVSGYSGSTCHTQTAFIDLAIGEVIETENKTGFYPEGLDVEAKVTF